MKKENRTYLMYLEDIRTAMNRIAEYISEMSFKNHLNHLLTDK